MNKTLEHILCALHQQSYATLTVNATTGLVLALKALGLRGKRIGIPNSVCPNVPIAILLSGNSPLYLDISVDNFGIDIGDLARHADELGAVIAVHAYGNVCDIVAIAEFCQKRCLPLIEDLAVAQGASIDGFPVGSFADIAVVSFGAGKVIDVGHGGAVLTSQQSIMKDILALVEQLPLQNDEMARGIHEFGQYHTELYNKDFAAGTINERCHQFKTYALNMGGHILGRFLEKYRPLITARLEHLDATIQLRRDRAKQFESLLAPHESLDFMIHRSADGSVPWRFNVLIPEQQKLLRSMLRKNIKVSSWFPSADLFFEERANSGVDTPVADRISKQILNLWVNENVDDAYIYASSTQLINHISAQ